MIYVTRVKEIYQLKITVSVKNKSTIENVKWKFYYVAYLVSTQEFGSIVSERFNTEKTHMQFSHELL